MNVHAETKFDYTACAVEYNHDLDVFAVGTYELVDTQTDKDGRISHQQRKGDCSIYDCTGRSFRKLSSRDTPGTLDMKWSKDLLGIVDAEGMLSIDRYAGGSLAPLLSVDCKAASSSSPSLALSLDWNNVRREADPVVAVSMSDGRALTVDARTQQTLQDWQAHDFETWIAAWDHYSNDTLYTGADDCIFKAWDLRSGVDTPVLSNKRFDGGVTTITNSPHNHHELAVGSYDESLRLFDKRNLKTPTATIATSGGIWRIKYHITNPTALVTASMYGGFDVVDLESKAVTFTNSDHNLGYGVDWNTDGLIMSASFYDKKGMLWNAAPAPC
ncbi:hypothetical protein E3P99_00897 [Wallemia hederae]|uniref:methylated diphthine methylhydrolase n=1 Tax=Wallemia hederae TaxID=1540922 RepID=A0A4T0FTB9_9BASI|nr:hypothetical protein E3P99_00897 [Wallemia hederae]